MAWLSELLRYILTTAFHTTWDLITPENIAQAIGALAAMLALVISLTHIVRHWKYNCTKLRKSTVRLLFVVPIFAMDSWACLMLEASVYRWAEVLTCLREVYEAVALVSFMELIFTILGGTANLARLLQSESDPLHPQMVQHVGPLRRVLPPYKAGPEFVRAMLLGIFQYVCVCLTYLAISILIWGLSCLHLVDPAASSILKVVPNIVKAASCAWALNCLLLFAHEVYEHVPPCGLALKFLSIKGIIFFTFWQGFVIWCWQRSGRLHKIQMYMTEKSGELGLDPYWWDQAQLKSGLNDLLLCIEVLGFSILHLFAYPVREGERLPPFIRARIGDASSDAPERLLSAVNLMNLYKLRDEVDRLEELSPRNVTRSWRKAFDAFRYVRRSRAAAAKAMRCGEASSPLIAPAGEWPCPADGAREPA